MWEREVVIKKANTVCQSVFFRKKPDSEVWPLDLNTRSHTHTCFKTHTLSKQTHFQNTHTHTHTHTHTNTHTHVSKHTHFWIHASFTSERVGDSVCVCVWERERVR